MSVAAFLREFHETYGVPIRSEPVANPPESDLRTRLLAEEVQEYYDAVEADDVIEVADALADIVYVAYGSALAHGIDLDAVLAEVHRSNMSKLGKDGKPVLREDGKVIKGPDYFRPDVRGVLFGAALPVPCPVCGGAGIVDTSPPGVEHTAPWLLTDTDCAACDGTGEIDPTTYEPDIEES